MTNPSQKRSSLNQGNSKKPAFAENILKKEAFRKWTADRTFNSPSTGLDQIAETYISF